MRVLIVPVILALATAAPSGDLKVAAPLAVLPVVTPTIDPGDIQAAAINAQVAAEDQARAAADKIVEENNEKVIESDSLVKEKTEEVFWAGEDKKWQALDAVQTVEAKIDGAVASNADAIARSALGGVVLPNYVAPALLPAPLVRTPIIPGTPIAPGYPLYGPPIISPISPIIYTPNLIAKDGEKDKQIVKTAEPEKDKQVLQTFYPGQIVTDYTSPVSPVAYNIGKKEDEKEKVIGETAELDKDEQQVEKDKEIVKTAEIGRDNLQIVQYYPARFISPGSYLFYNNINSLVKKEDNEKRTEIVKTAEPESDKQQVFQIYPNVNPAIPPYSPIFYNPGIVTKEVLLKHNTIEHNDELKKEEKRPETENAEKLEMPLEKATKLEKQERPLVAPILPYAAPQPLVASQQWVVPQPLVAPQPLVPPQPWPLSRVAPVYAHQPFLTPVLNTQW